MRYREKQIQGQSLIEYAILIVFIFSIFLVFQKYIARGIYGRWKSAGDGIGYGRLYDPHKTLECVYFREDRFFDSDGRPPQEFWYNLACYEENDCDCFSILRNTVTCLDCAVACQTPKCND